MKSLFFKKSVLIPEFFAVSIVFFSKADIVYLLSTDAFKTIEECTFSLENLKSKEINL